MARTLDLIDSSGVLSTITLIASTATGITAPPGGFGEALLNRRHLLGDDPTESNQILEKWQLMLKGSSQDNAATQLTALLTMLRKAARFAVDPAQSAPVYIKEQTASETNPRYALCYGAYELTEPKLFGRIFDVAYWIQEFGVTLIREHPWTSGVPGVLPTATTLTATDGPASPTTVHLSGMRDNNIITHIYVHDISVGFSANLAGQSTFNLFPAAPVVDDILYIGSTTGPLHNIVIPVATAGVYSWTLVPEVWTGAAWVALTVGTEYAVYPTETLTSLFKVTGDWVFDIYGKTGWATTAINAVTAWWLRLRINPFTSITTVPATGTAPPYAARSNFLELPSTALKGDMPAKVLLRCSTPSGGTDAPGPGNTSRIIIGSKSRNLAASEFTAQLDNSALTGWAYSYGTDAASANSFLAPSYTYTNVTFATDSTLVPRWTLTGSSKLLKWVGRYRAFVLAVQTGGAAGDCSVRLRTWIGASTAGSPKYDTPSVELKAISPGAPEVVDLGTLRLPWSEEINADILTADLIFQVMASRDTGAATLGIFGLFLMPIDELSCVADDPVSDPVTGTSALRGGSAMDIDGGILKIRAVKLQSTVLTENWPREGRPPSLEPGLLTRIYALQMYYPTAWGTGPMLCAHGKHMAVTLYAHSRYSTLRGSA